ncbi:MAG: arylesterase [Gammaproteobacteria bacterium]|nr:arylesterase [Gammaproteobacteria bacterium]MCW8959020.1 arylesterase [Gammaproteobacteria bacterium]MCW8972281.1 arylesterase [Gammaproteobacteria bacterium]MCW8991876.1 arylesterase [Gammaproteobacteria bacterium]
MKRRLIHLPLILLLALLLAGCSEDSPTLQPLSRDAVILAFGDSLTRGNGANADNSYPAVLERLSGRRVINAGVPGEHTPAGLARLAGVLEQYHPELLLLCHGGNDMLRRHAMEAMQSNLEQMVALARERGIQVVLLGVPRPAIFGLESAEPYYAVAKSAGIPLEDKIIPEVLSDNNLKSDQIHPNAEGYQRIAEAVYRLLQQTGAL